MPPRPRPAGDLGWSLVISTHNRRLFANHQPRAPIRIVTEPEGQKIHFPRDLHVLLHKIGLDQVRYMGGFHLSHVSARWALLAAGGPRSTAQFEGRGSGSVAAALF